MNKRKVSVVVPIYNMKLFLKGAIESLLLQTYQNIEIILVDDGSTDDSVQICDEYAVRFPEKVKVIHKANGGLSSARNKGIEFASGDYIIFPDPDDWVEPTYIERLVDLYSSYSADLSCINYCVEYGDSSVKMQRGTEIIQFNSHEARRSLFMQPSICGFAWNKLYCLDIIKKNHLFFLDDVGTTEDMDFAYRYLKYCNKVVFDPQAFLYHYYQRSGAATDNKFTLKKLEAIHTYEKIVEDSETQDPALCRAAREEICNTAVNLTWMYGCSDMKDKSVKRKIKNYVKDNLSLYVKSCRYGTGRKIQALLAYFTPSIYIVLKEITTSRKRRNSNDSCRYSDL